MVLTVLDVVVVAAVLGFGWRGSKENQRENDGVMHKKEAVGLDLSTNEDPP